MKKILSIDGGGIRGIIPGQVLVALEQKLQEKEGKEARLADYFDFFAGTSTGGILTCICLCPSEIEPGKARFSAQDAVNLYIENGDDIFSVPFWKNVQSGGGNLDEKYPADKLEEALKRYFGDLKLSELLKPCLIPSYNITERTATFFCQHDFKEHGPKKDFYVRDVCRATSAAPTYFETAFIHSLNGSEHPLIDGGVFANNPALCAYSEVRNAIDQPTAKEMLIVSLGTGSENKKYPYDKAKNWGAIGWIKPVIDIMMAGAAEVTHYHLCKMFSARGNDKNYIRIQPTDLDNADPDMDNASDKNIQALVEVGKKTAESCNAELDRIVDILIRDKDKVEFEDHVVA